MWKKTEIILSMESNGTFDNVFRMQHKELVMAVNMQSHTLCIFLNGMTKVNELIDKSLKMAFHMEFVVEKLTQRVD